MDDAIDVIPRSAPENNEGRDPGQPEANLILAILTVAREDYLKGTVEDQKSSIKFFESDLLREYCECIQIDPEKYLEAAKTLRTEEVEQLEKFKKSRENRRNRVNSDEKIKRLRNDHKLSIAILSYRFAVPEDAITQVLNGEISNRELKKMQTCQHAR